MAKSLRATRTKNNKTRLRKTVFEKVENERNDRLSAKLIEIAKAPKPSKSKEVDMDAPEAEASRGAQATNSISNDEHVDAMALDKPKATKKASARGGHSRIGKRRKTSKGIVFPIGKKHGAPKAQGRKRKS